MPGIYTDEHGERRCLDCGESIEAGAGFCKCSAPRSIAEDWYTDGFKLGQLVKEERALIDFVAEYGQVAGMASYYLKNRTSAGKIPDTERVFLQQLCEHVNRVHYGRRNYAETGTQQPLFDQSEEDHGHV